MPTETLKYEIAGKFITNAAQEKLLHNLDFCTALKLVKGSLQTDSLPEDQITGMAVKVLDGQAEIKGTYPLDDYGYEETPNDNHLLEKYSNKIQQIISDLEETKAQNAKLEQKLAFIETNIRNEGERLAEEYETEMNEELFSEYGEYGRRNRNKQKMLNMQLAELKQAMEHKNNYGWLDPAGNFYPVDWSEHTAWAAKYINTHFDESEISNEDSLYPTDALVDRGWVLLHNPGKGLPKATKPIKITKKQADFLYEFFTERNMKKEADEIMRNDYE